MTNIKIPKNETKTDQLISEAVQILVACTNVKEELFALPPVLVTMAVALVVISFSASAKC